LEIVHIYGVMDIFSPTSYIPIVLSLAERALIEKRDAASSRLDA
jgi:hypothetical protein